MLAFARPPVRDVAGVLATLQVEHAPAEPTQPQLGATLTPQAGSTTQVEQPPPQLEPQLGV